MDKPGIAKFAPPRAGPALIPRPRLHTALRGALQEGSVWLAAPAGYGKSTALLDYLRHADAPCHWYRIDEGDQDIASFFFDLARSLPGPADPPLPLFGAEYAHQPEHFARRFFRAWLACLAPGSLIVFDDLHYTDTPLFRAVFAQLLRELPAGLGCLCASRSLPAAELDTFLLQGQLRVIGQAALEFRDDEARELLAARLQAAAARLDVGAARGWAMGLVLIAARADFAALPLAALRHAGGGEAALFELLGQQLFDTLGAAEQDALMQLSLLPEISAEVAATLAGPEAARITFERLHQRQLLVVRGQSERHVFQLHDLLRDFLKSRLTRLLPPPALRGLKRRVARRLAEAGYADAAIDLALQGEDWPAVRRLIGQHAEQVLAQGRRATLTDWCARLPAAQHDDWLCYWLGVAHSAEDSLAEPWLARAWQGFAASGDRRGAFLAVARALISKTDSWRTHAGLPDWTRRALDLLAGGLPQLQHIDEELLVLTGLSRALDYAEDYARPAAARADIRTLLLQRLAAGQGMPSLRLLASETLIEHAGSLDLPEVFAQAVDSVADEVQDSQVSPWALGLWLVAFGTVSGRYFSYARRGFAYASAEQALRAAIAIGQREGLRGVEFGALYHLQLQLKLRNDLAGLVELVARLGEIADSRHTTQVAVVADCEAAWHTLRGDPAQAWPACTRFLAAIERGQEPPIERWPHYLTCYQVLLAEQRHAEAADYLAALAPQYEGGVRQRAEACVTLARALQLRAQGDAAYVAELGIALGALRATHWTAALPNLPTLLAQCCADALQHDVENDFCRLLIAQRRLAAPAARPRRWPWPLRIFLLGEFRLERAGAPLALGAKVPSRALDILRVLAICKEQSCSLEQIGEWLWPDADGDQARAACEQALHRLRKLLGDAELVQQREGRLRLAMDKIWLDLDDWRSATRLALDSGDAAALDAALADFSGPLLLSERAAAWSLAAREQVRGLYLAAVEQRAALFAASAGLSAATQLWQRALDHYPDSLRALEALVGLRVAQADTAGALEDYARYQRLLRALGMPASAALRRLIAPLAAARGISDT
jgi:LuxR family transcriptional regulator, maltose regulon positive regulatory protein